MFKDLCFEGSTSGGCPAALPPAAGNAVPCNSDADCQTDTDSYESCAQRDPGAFSLGAATRMSLTGSSAGECLGDAAAHAADLVAPLCIPPTFNPTYDAGLSLPGPGAMTINGTVTLSP